MGDWGEDCLKFAVHTHKVKTPVVGAFVRVSDRCFCYTAMEREFDLLCSALVFC